MKIKYTATGDEIAVQFIGELDTPSAEEIQPEIDKLLEHSSKRITIDCTGLTYIASSGLRLFITIHKRCKSDGGRMILEGVSPDVMEILSITNFDKVFEIR